MPNSFSDKAASSPAPVKRLSRFSDDPTGVPLTVSPKDIEIFKLLDPERRYSILPTNWIQALLGGDPTWMSKRLGRLSRRPYKYLHRPEEQWTFNALYKHALYRRADKADQYLIEQGLLRRRAKRRTDALRHQLLDNLVDASIELGVTADPALSLLDWHGILDHPKTPAALSDANEPFRLRIGEQSLIPDGRPFVLRRSQADGRALSLCILGKEIDRATEPLRPSRMRHTSIARKFELYRKIFNAKLYQSHYGFPNAMVLIVTVSEAHMQNMMALAAEIMGGKCSYLLFKTIEDFANIARSPQVSTAMLETPWQRAGYPPFYLSTFSERPRD